MPYTGFMIGISFEPPILPDTYECGGARITVSYPSSFDRGGLILPLPPRASVVFLVEWPDGVKVEMNPTRPTNAATKTVFDALDIVSQFLLHFLLVRIGHIDSSHIRTVGIADTLFYCTTLDGKPHSGVNSRAKVSYMRDDLSQAEQIDPLETTKLAYAQINNPTMPIARRYARCYELLDRGYYREATIVAFSILDDIVQEVLRSLLDQHGLVSDSEKKTMLRAVKEDRLRIYLGPMLKLLWGNDVDYVWSHASTAVAWLNTERNTIAHQGGLGSRPKALLAVFVCVQLTAGFHKFELVDAEIPWNMLREARLWANWWSAGQGWIPKDDEIEQNPFA